MPPTVLEVKSLNFYYAKQQVLRDINLRFKADQVTAIIGPSGSGKSTLLRTLNRIYELYPRQRAEGEVLFNGENILQPHTNLTALRCTIGMVFQKPTPFPMSIFENIAFPIRTHEKISKSALHGRVELALKQAALWSEVKDKLHQAGTHLSGGQQQRLCIARTLAIRPQVLLLDEPTSALDPIAVAKLEELITQLKSTYTIILVTHNLKQALRVSDETVFMKDGRVVECAPTQQLFHEPQLEETRLYVEGH